VSDSTTMYMT